MICGSQKRPLARKYARAFLKVFSDLEQESLFASLDALEQCCLSTPLVFYTLLLSSARLEEKCKSLDVLCTRLNIIDPVKRLLETLLSQKKLDILPALVPIIKHEYKKMRNLHDVVVTSAHPLTEKEQKQIEQTVSEHLSGSLTFMYQQDDSLVAGIRIQTETHYWEHSVAKVARMLEHRLAMQEQV